MAQTPSTRASGRSKSKTPTRGVRSPSKSKSKTSKDDPQLSQKKSVPKGIYPPPARRSGSTEYDVWFIIDAVLMCTIATAGIIAAVRNNQLLYLIPVSMAEAKLGLIAHEACHGAAPSYLAWLYDCALGSNAQWIFKHNKGHHLHTNSLDDPDLDVSPVLRMHPQHPRRWFHRYQHLYQYILFAVVPVSLRAQGVLYLHANGGWIDILTHWVLAAPATYLYLVWPVLKYGFPTGLKFFFTR